MERTERRWSNHDRPQRDVRSGDRAGNIEKYRQPRERVPGATREADRSVTEDGKHYVVGRRAALELLRDEASISKIEKLYLAHGVQGPQIAEIVHYARTNKLAIGELDRGKFRELERRTGDTDAQGVILLIAQRAYQELEDVVEIASPPLLIALDGIEDPHNIGAVIRSAEASGAGGILLPKRGAVLTPAVYKTSAGAASHLPIVKVGNLEQTIRKLQEELGVVCVGLAGEAEESIYDIDLTGPICFVTGSEEKGLHRLVRERCEKVVKIPLTGKTASLNASVASAVALFEAVRQRTSRRDDSTSS